MHYSAALFRDASHSSLNGHLSICVAGGTQTNGPSSVTRDIQQFLPRGNAMSYKYTVKSTWSHLFLLCQSKHDSECFMLKIEPLNLDALATEIKMPPQVSEILDFVCGSEHILLHCARHTKTDVVLGLGWNEHGNLGIGNTINADKPVVVWEASQNTKVIRLWAGNGTSWIYSSP